LSKSRSTSVELAKPFQLVKYFTYTSLVLVLVGTLVLSLSNTHWARSMLREKSEEYSRLLIENLNHQVFTQFVLPVAVRYGQIELRREEQFERMDKVVRSTFHSFQVEMVNIYDRSGTIAYSFDTRRIGKTDAGGREVSAALAGETLNRLRQKGNWLQILLGFPEESRLATYAPLRAERPMSFDSGPVLGAVEIVQDISPDYQAVFAFQIAMMITSTLVLGTLLAVLVLVVKRGEHIIEQRNLERLRLKEELSRAAHLSSLGEMIAAVSHEIRNPLGIIRSSAELLKKRLASGTPITTIPQIIVEESSRLNGIITDFLNYARPRQPNLVERRIAEVLEKVLNNLGSELEAKGCPVERRYDDALPPVPMDPDMLYQAFLNILINAMQAMPGGGQIRVGTRCQDGWAVVCIEDEGHGLPEPDKEKIWDPFFTTKDTGTGLGLGIVRKTIEAHHGDVRIENRSEGGARVIVRLPLRPG
jgi:signal transduction histidine kinase